MSLPRILSNSPAVCKLGSINEALNMGNAHTLSQAFENHAKFVCEKMAALHEINEQNIDTCLPAIKIVHARFNDRKKILEERLLKLNGRYHQDANSLLHQVSLQTGPSAEQKLQKLIAERDAIVKELEEINQKISRSEKIGSFLKVRKIEIQIGNLCGGDPNSLLDRAWKAFQAGTGSEKSFIELEERKNSLIVKREKLQLLSSNISLSCIQKELPNIISVLQLEQQEALEAVDFIQNLKNWCTENCSSQEMKDRIKACERILVCYVKQDMFLDLSCGLTSLPGAIGKLVNLKLLQLSDNQLQALPAEIGNLVHLVYLEINNNQLLHLPPEFGNLVHLVHLEIKNNQLQTLPESIGNLVNLKYLKVDENQLQTLPESIGNLMTLEGLHINNNQLQALPAEFGNLVKLKELHVTNNQLLALPESIGNLVDLKYLKVEQNNLHALPPEIGNLANLERLDVQSNQLRALPPEIGNLANLERLDVQSNQLHALPSCLARLSSSCRINCNNNRLSHGAIQTFQAQIAQQGTINPNCGPNFEFSIYDANQLTHNSSLKDIMAFWLQQFQGNFSPENSNYKQLPSCMFGDLDIATSDFYKPLMNLSKKQNNLLRTFLIRLKQTDDFNHPSSCQALIVNVVCMLHGACTSEAFTEQLFIILDDALSTCGDRVANAFNMIYLVWLLECKSKTSGKEGLAKILIGATRLDKVEQFAREIVKKKKLGDQIETILYFKVKLKEALGLPVATEGMLYPAMSGITKPDLKEAKTLILNQTSSFDQTLKILIDSDHWKEKIKQENAEQIAKMTDQFSAKIEKIMENDQLSFPEMDALMKPVIIEKDQAIQTLINQLTVAWLKNESNISFMTGNS